MPQPHLADEEALSKQADLQHWYLSENGLFEPFIYKNDLFTETGSGQT